MRLPLLFLLLFALAACSMLGASPAVAPAMALDPTSYRLGTGDHVRIDVYGEPDLSVEAEVQDNGVINYPLLGRVQAKGLTANQLEQSLKTRLAQGYLVNPNVRVGVSQFRPFFVYGQVQHAGQYAYIEGLNVEKAIALAGGMTAVASTRKIFILRESSSPGVREKAALQTLVYPGDTILIEESLF